MKVTLNGNGGRFYKGDDGPEKTTIIELRTGGKALYPWCIYQPEGGEVKLSYAQAYFLAKEIMSVYPE